MHQATLAAAFFDTSHLVVAMCSAGIALFLIAALAARREIAEARGLDKLVALSNLCYAIPLGVFSMLHFFGPEFVKDLVPKYMPWRMFWVYLVGCALLSASLSVAARIAVRWSGLLVGILMFTFVAMIYLPSGLRHFDARFTWTIVFRESSFGGAGWLLAGAAINGWPGWAKRTLIIVGGVCVTLALIFFAIEQVLHPMGLPGVPLRQDMPAWVPGRVVIGYLTGAALLVAAGSVLLQWKTREVTASVAGWILLTILVIYTPFMFGALLSPGTEVKVVGINYFADTLLFAGVILALARAAPQFAAMEWASVPSSAGDMASPTRAGSSASSAQK